MCKVLFFTETKDIKNFPAVVNHIAHQITKQDDDGFGWAALTKSGRVMGEKSIEDKPRYTLNRIRMTAPYLKETYQKIGQHSKPQGPAIFHGRTSTNQLGMLNTHPIDKNNFYLVHNGVVDNEGPEYSMKTTNDTEHLVHYLSTEGMSGIEKHLSGYFAFGAIDVNSKKLHIARCNMAFLLTTYIKTIDSHIFATTRELIESTCKKFQWEYMPIESVQDFTYIVFNSNEVVECREIKFQGIKTTYQTAMMGTSLHYSPIAESSWSQPNPNDVPDLNGYLDKIETSANSSWKFYLNDTQLELSEFLRLSDTEKLKCDVYDDNFRSVEPDYFKIESKVG